MTSPSVSHRGRLLRLGIWVGLVYGFLEALEFFVLGWVPGALAWRNGNATPVFVVAPVFYAACYTLVALVVAGLSRLLPRWPWEAMLVALLVSVSAYLGASLQGQLFSPLASVLIGLGFGAVAVRLVRARSQLITQVLKTLPLVAVSVAAVGLVAVAVPMLRERAALRALPEREEGPNVVLVVLDTQRADHLSLHGYERPTSPALDAIGRQGMVFENAISSSSWTLPSHASMLTGHPANRHLAGEVRRPYLSSELPTLAEVLGRAGYVTAGFVANTFWVGRQTGLDRGFLHWEDFYRKAGDALVRTVLGRKVAYELLPKFGRIDIPGRMRVGDINRRFFTWVDGLDGRPFFVLLNYLDVHGPYLPPPPYAGRFGGSLEHVGRAIALGAITDETTVPPPDLLQDWVNRYDESILSLDAGLDELMEGLAARSLLDGSIVIITSDHGESFGEHGMIYHGHGLYRDQIHVPLLIRYPPAVGAGLRDPSPVSIEQIPSTVMDLVGLPSEVFPAPSLLSEPEARMPVLAEVGYRSQVPAAWPTSRGWVKSLTTARWHFILEENGHRELYDIVADPAELVNLAGEAAYQDTVAGLLATLARVTQGDPRP